MSTNPSKVAAITMSNATKLNRLLQLCSANLPVGGFSFSQGLEHAVEHGWITTQEETERWIVLNLQQSVGQTDLVLLKRLFNSLSHHDFDQFSEWNQQLIACRESNELLLADLAMGKALVRLLRKIDRLDSAPYESLLELSNISFVSAFVITGYLFELDLHSLQSGYCWTYIDNQVAAATKLVPLGQTQAQNLLFDLTEEIDEVIVTANTLDDEDIGASLPRLAMASAWHETQYSRLFRS